MIISNVQPCGLEHMKKCYFQQATKMTLSTEATALTIYGINKFVLWSLSHTLHALVNCFYNIMGQFEFIAASRCILVLFEPYGCQKEWAQKGSCNTFSIYIWRKNYVKYSLWILKNKNLFKRHKYTLNIKYSRALSYNHWGFLHITKLSNP